MDASPFYLNYGQHPWIPLNISLDNSEVGSQGHAPHADKVFQRMSQLFAMAKKHLLAAQCRQKAYADTKSHDVTFVEGDWVLLSTEYLRLQGSRKLLPRFVGSFLITKIVGKHAYWLELPPHMRIHPVMHVSLHQPHRAGQQSPWGSLPTTSNGHDGR